MEKETWKAGNMLYPLPAVMVSVSDGKGNDNIITVAWAGTVCTNPPMVSISVRPSRFSYDMLRKTGEFVINLPYFAFNTHRRFCDHGHFHKIRFLFGKLHFLKFINIPA